RSSETTAISPRRLGGLIYGVIVQLDSALGQLTGNATNQALAPNRAKFCCEAMLRKNIVILSAVLLSSSTLPAETGPGSICISPVPKKATNTAAVPDFFCDSPKLSVKIDAKEPLAWPIGENVKVRGSATPTRRRENRPFLERLSWITSAAS